MILYHSTYRVNIQSIKQLGLGSRQRKNWSSSKLGELCFTNNPDVAYYFCENADMASEYKYNSGIIVLAFDSSILTPAYLSVEKTKGNITCYTYVSVIDSQNLFVVQKDKGIVGKLNELRKIPAYV